MAPLLFNVHTNIVLTHLKCMVILGLNSFLAYRTVAFCSISFNPLKINKIEMNLVFFFVAGL